MSPPHEPPSKARERELFLGALELRSPEARETYLDTACAGDTSLRQRIEELLHEESNVGEFLLRPALIDTTTPGRSAGGVDAQLMADLIEKPGDRIGRYRLLEQIGEGGCGVVYRAEQEEPVRRPVAVKVIKLGMDTRSVIARFEAERQALAMMDHANIARVFDAGATGAGRPFFVMELVCGDRITAFCQRNALPLRDRLRLVIQVCQAVQHAHQKGIIHRDLKPSNILVAWHDGVPVPKIIDFGIAKATEQRLTEKTFVTGLQSLIGTPAYMSPEQAELGGLDVDTRSDIYALGVLLYELLTGTTPFEAKEMMSQGLDAMRKAIREVEPPRPSTRLMKQSADRKSESRNRKSGIPADLDWIVMKCLEKDRTRRYATANALAYDLQRYLDNEPVLARPPGSFYRLGKFLDRHRLAVGGAAGFFVVLLAAVTISTRQAVRATRAEALAQAARREEGRLRRQAERERAAARLNEYVADMNLAQHSVAMGNYGRAVQLVEKHRPAVGEPDLRGFEWRYLWRLGRGDDHTRLPDQPGNILAVALSPNGDQVAVGLRGQLRILEVPSGRLVTALPAGAVSLAYLPGGHLLISGDRSGVRVWRTADWTEATSLPGATGPIALSKNGALLATQGEDGVRVWDTSTWSSLRFVPGARSPMAFAPDSQALATDSRPGIAVWPLFDERAEVVLQDSANRFTRVGPAFTMDRVLAFSADGRSMVAPRNGMTANGAFVISVWDASSGLETAVIPDDPERPRHTGVIAALALSPDGRTLATASWDHSIRLWDPHAGRMVGALQGHQNEVWAVAFSADGRSIVSGAKDGGLNLWPLHPAPEAPLLPSGWTPLGFSGDSRRLAAFNAREGVAFFDLETREPGSRFRLDTARPGFRPALSVSADLRVLAWSADDGGVQLWDTETEAVRTLRFPEGRCEFLALSPDGRVLLAGGRGQPLHWWEPDRSVDPILAIEAQSVLFAADGHLLVAFGTGNAAQVWDVATRSLRRTLLIEPEPERNPAALSPDGRVLATTAGPNDVDNAVHLWSTETGRRLGVCLGHKQSVWSIAFAPDGRTLASSGDDGALKLWNVETQQELLSIQRPGNTLRGLIFSPDGRLLIGTGGAWPEGVEISAFQAPTFAETDERRGTE